MREIRNRRMRVVVIDDHDIVRRNLRELIEISGNYEIVGEGSNGHQAIDLADRLSPDLVLMDVNMPEMGGVEATEVIKDAHPDVKVLALTAFGDMSNVSSMIKAGAEGYLLKGGRTEELLNSLEAVARGKVALGEQVAIGAIKEYADLEARYLQAQKMEAVGRLAGGIAHDFNNLLAVIENYSRFIAEDMTENDPAYGDLNEILSASERAKQLVRQLLSFSRKEAAHPEVVDLNDAVSSIQTMLERTIGEDVRLQTMLADDVSSIEIDPSQLDQVIMNLVVNARDAMPEGGDIWITTANSHLSTGDVADLPAGEYVSMTIVDDGCGMPEDVVEKIFEPFYTTKPKDWGTGLGLSTVYGIVKQAHGTISVDSRVGEGTRFTVYFPTVRQTSELALTPPRDASITVRHGTAMVVEDDQAVCRLVERILSRNGYTVIAAGNGDEALEFLGRHALQLDVLVTDLVMPGMSGRELAIEMQKHQPDIGIVFMSGHGHEVVERHGVSAEDPGYLPKPFSADDLLLKIATVVQQPEEAAAAVS